MIAPETIAELRREVDMEDPCAWDLPGIRAALLDEIERHRTECTQSDCYFKCGHSRADHDENGKCTVGVEIDEGWATCSCEEFKP